MAIIGLLGAWALSAIFFGLFTLGLFLVFYDQTMKREEVSSHASRPNSVTSLPTNLAHVSSTCPNCGMVLDVGGTFCPRCGEKMKME